MRSPTTELKCGWWLLTWHDSSTAFSMTEPARSARSNSFRQFSQVTTFFFFTLLISPFQTTTKLFTGLIIRTAVEVRLKTGNEAPIRLSIIKARYRELSNYVKTFPQQLTVCQSLSGNTRYPQSHALLASCGSSPPCATVKLHTTFTLYQCQHIPKL